MKKVLLLYYYRLREAELEAPPGCDTLVWLRMELADVDMCKPDGLLLSVYLTISGGILPFGSCVELVTLVVVASTNVILLSSATADSSVV